jgi:hypothetical protein
MEEPQNMDTNDQSDQKPRSLRKRLLLIGGVIVGVPVVLFIGLVLYFAITGAGKDSTGNGSASTTDEFFAKALKAKPGETNGPYYERQSYARNEIGKTIADAMGMETSKPQDTVKLNDGTPIVQACTLLSPGDLQKANLPLAAEAQTSRPDVITQSYVDGRGTGPIATDYLLGTENVNICRYELKETTSYVEIHVVQDFHLQKEQLPYLLKDADPVSGLTNESGVEVFKLKNTNNFGDGYIVHAGQTYAQLEIDMIGNDNQKAKAKELVKPFISTLLKITKKPEGAVQVTYRNSPTYKTTYLSACSMLSEKALQTLGNTQASAYVVESITTATGVATFTSIKDQTPYVYVQNKCARDGLINKEPNAHLEITTSSYKDTKGAEQHMASTNNAAADKMDLANVADQAVLTTSKDEGGKMVLHLIFRKGRIVLDAAYSKDTSIQDLTAFQPKTQALAQELIERLPDF